MNECGVFSPHRGWHSRRVLKIGCVFIVFLMIVTIITKKKEEMQFPSRTVAPMPTHDTAMRWNTAQLIRNITKIAIWPSAVSELWEAAIFWLKQKCVTEQHHRENMFVGTDTIRCHIITISIASSGKKIKNVMQEWSFPPSQIGANQSQYLSEQSQYNFFVFPMLWLWRTLWNRTTNNSFWHKNCWNQLLA